VQPALAPEGLGVPDAQVALHPVLSAEEVVLPVPVPAEPGVRDVQVVLHPGRWVATAVPVPPDAASQRELLDAAQVRGSSFLQADELAQPRDVPVAPVGFRRGRSAAKAVPQVFFVLGSPDAVVEVEPLCAAEAPALAFPVWPVRDRREAGRGQ